MRAGGGARGAAFLRTRQPDERDEREEQERRGVEKIERGERERLLVDEPVQVGVGLLGRQSEAAEARERLARRRVVQRRALDQARVVQRGAALPERRGERGAERAGGEAQEVVE